MTMNNEHWKFVGWVDAIDTPGNVWCQRVLKSTLLGYDEFQIEWHLTKVPLPDGAEEGTYVSVHKTKAGDWYAVNLSERMPPITESQVKRSKAEARRLARYLGIITDPDPKP